MASINDFFLLFKTINVNIKNKFNDGEEISFKEYYYYEATTLALSIIREKEISNDISLLTLVEYKALIEVMAIMFDSVDELELLKTYNNKVEEDLYNKYKSLNFKFHFNKNEFNNNIDKNTLKNQIIEKLPFIIGTYDFKNIITKNTKLYEYYEYILEILNEPTVDVFRSVEFMKKIGFLDGILLALLYAYFIKKYPNIDSRFNNTIDYEKSFIYNHPLNKRYHNFALVESSILAQANYELLSKMVISISIDKAYGNSEVLEMKFKFFVDYIMKTLNVDLNELIEIAELSNAESKYFKLIYREAKYLSYLNGYMLISEIELELEYIKVVHFIDRFINLIVKSEKLGKLIEEKFVFDKKHRLEDM